MRERSVNEKTQDRDDEGSAAAAQTGDGITGVESGADAAQPAATSPDGPVIVGIGASAGGLDAFTEILRHLPVDTGLALVFIQHLAPTRQSALPHLLGNATRMPVEQVGDGLRPQPNHVYVIPPAVEMTLERGHLRLVPRDEGKAVFLPIDRFFHSLAGEAQARAVGVVLSGTGADGAEGLREIVAAGGIALVQDPKESRYDGMPRSAIALGAADCTLGAAGIAAELERIARLPSARHRRPRRPAEDIEVSDEQFAEIFDRLREASGVDFSHYKPGTVRRRLQRRILLNRLHDVAGYIKLLKEQPGEIDALYRDILIHVTQFFREPKSFEVLKEEVLPRIFDRARGTVRCWVPGCATGEEVYSLAIVLNEVLGGRREDVTVQIFGTDVSGESIEEARRGLFPESIAGDVGPERLRRYFTRIDHQYRIAQALRDQCVFARQDLTRDPPFSNLDLILCRNVLIYLGHELQKKVLGIFHYALRAEGYLALGSAETVGANSDLFSPLDKRQRIFTRLPVPSPRARSAPDYPPRRGDGTPAPAPVQPRNPFAPAEQLLLDAYTPAAVIVNDELRIVHARGKTGPYLELAAGDPDLHLLKMARPGLLHGLRSALFEARREGHAVHLETQRVSGDDERRVVNLAVWPVLIDGSRHFLVAFEDAGASTSADRERTPLEPTQPLDDSEAAQRIHDMQEELDANRAFLQSTIQDLEAANEELQSANEEILSSNEELQSTNEELDTAKEELQSTNEELNTVNEELQARNDELSAANGDLSNLLASVEIAIVMVSLDLCVRRFTPMAERLFNLIKGDVGRPIGHVRPNIDFPDLETAIARVIDQVQPIEHEVRDNSGHWYSLRIRPYKSLDNRIDGAVLVLLDIDSNKRHASALQEANRYTQAMMQCLEQPVLVLDAELRVRAANQVFFDFFQVSPAETEGRFVYQLGDGQWDIPGLRQLLEDLLPEHRQLDDYRVSHEFPQLGWRTLSLCARAIENDEDGIGAILLLIREIPEGDGNGN